MSAQPNSQATQPGLLDRFLNVVERMGNKLPDPAVLFLIAMLLVWLFSALLANVQFSEIDPRNGKPIQIQALHDVLAKWLGEDHKAAAA